MNAAELIAAAWPWLLGVGGLLALFLLWLLVPLTALWCLPVPVVHKLRASACFVGALARAALPKLFGLSAYLVVPLLVRRLSWSAESLARLDGVYGNNWGVNGDKRLWIDPEGTGAGIPLPVSLLDTPEARALCYWCPGEHPRSAKARRAWLTRNRCTNLSLQLGKPWPTGPKQAWGDIDTEKSRPGWVLFEQGGLYHLHGCLALGGRVLRISFGYKLGKLRDRTFPRVPPTIVPASLPRRGDPEAAAAQDLFLSAEAKAEIAAIVRHVGA
ncbi:hypothetical protein [Xylophilus sp. Leaf220]|uniref:hypothetical protein n=1 Tax=Xylophilus sp. Leaf220 TaxID=1735686 RepID=UPI0006F86E12|nr:hypothetical protein [Xylophilus sp. Leaf220]KQM79807.1 hypothetical protein ASE76_00970 [Xylophilus sp. Leaf220]